jgi:hypothetical protein
MNKMFIKNNIKIELLNMYYIYVVCIQRDTKLPQVFSSLYQKII